LRPKVFHFAVTKSISPSDDGRRRFRRLGVAGWPFLAPARAVQVVAKSLLAD
jgi:hypothetical protein